MTKKQAASLTGIILAILTAVAAAVHGNTKTNANAVTADGKDVIVTERVRAVEVQYQGVEKRLDRIETKLDKLLEGR